MQIVVRPWQPADRFAAWYVLREASFSNLWPAFLIALKRPTGFMLPLVVLTLCVFFGADIVWTTLCVVCSVCVVYLGCLLATVYFLYGYNFNDMKTMESTYFSNPDDHFWVALAEGEVVGTIAIVRKQLPITTTSDKQTEVDNSATDEAVRKRKQTGESMEGEVPKIAWLRRMAVRKRCRGQGVAKRLVQAVIDFCRDRQYDSIFLITTEVHQPARNLYSSLGFRQKDFKPYKYVNGLFSVWTYEFELTLTE